MDLDAIPTHASSALLTSEQAGEYLHVNPRTLANWRVLGRGPRFVRSGSRALYRQNALDAWLDAHEFESTAAELVRRSAPHPVNRPSSRGIK
jgi:hypothetical protein